MRLLNIRRGTERFGIAVAVGSLAILAVTACAAAAPVETDTSTTAPDGQAAESVPDDAAASSTIAPCPDAVRAEMVASPAAVTYPLTPVAGINELLPNVDSASPLQSFCWFTHEIGATGVISGDKALAFQIAQEIEDMGCQPIGVSKESDTSWVFNSCPGLAFGAAIVKPVEAEFKDYNYPNVPSLTAPVIEVAFALPQ